MTFLRLGCILPLLLLAGCDSEGSELIGETFDVPCSGDLTEIGGEQFDFRTVNNCGNGILFYTTDLTSESGRVTATFRVSCGVRFCIGGAQVIEWNTN